MRIASLSFLLALAPAAAQVSPIDVRPGLASSQPVPVGEAGGRLVFGADDGAGRGLFATNGASVVRLAEGWARYQGVELNGALYLFICDDASACHLVRTDGTPGGTVRVAALPDAERLAYPAATADRLFFLLRPAGTGETQLWTSDGTAGGTRPVEGALPIVNDGLRYVITAGADCVFFSAGPGGTELWVSDGNDASRAAVFGGTRGGGFFYGTALGRGEGAFALVAEAEPRGLYAVDESGIQRVAALPVGASNETLVPFGEGVLFGAFVEGSEAGPPASPVAFYSATSAGIVRLSPDLPATDLRNHNVVSRLGDGSVALAVGLDESFEIWRVALGEQATLAFRLPEGEVPYSVFGLFGVAREARPAPAITSVGGVLHALSLRDDGTYSLWRDKGDQTAQLLASYRPDDPNIAPQFASAGGADYVTFETPGAGFEIVALGRGSTSTSLLPSAGSLAITIDGVHPVRSQTRFRLVALAGEHVRVEAFDALGRRVRLLLEGPAPEAPLDFDASGLTPGVYVVRAVTEAEWASVRVVVVR